MLYHTKKPTEVTTKTSSQCMSELGLSMRKSILTYMSSAWNLLDLAEIGMTSAWLCAACVYPRGDFLFPMGSIALLLVWFKLLFFFRAFQRTGPLVRMILAITAE